MHRGNINHRFNTYGNICYYKLLTYIVKQRGQK